MTNSNQDIANQLVESVGITKAQAEKLCAILNLSGLVSKLNSVSQALESQPDLVHSMGLTRAEVQSLKGTIIGKKLSLNELRFGISKSVSAIDLVA